MTFFIVCILRTIFIFNEYPHREMKLYIPFFVGVKMIIFIAGVFSGHILVKKIFLVNCIAVI